MINDMKVRFNLCKSAYLYDLEAAEGSSIRCKTVNAHLPVHLQSAEQAVFDRPTHNCPPSYRKISNYWHMVMNKKMLRQKIAIKVASRSNRKATSLIRPKKGSQSF